MYVWEKMRNTERAQLFELLVTLGNWYTQKSERRLLLIFGKREKKSYMLFAQVSNLKGFRENFKFESTSNLFRV